MGNENCKTISTLFQPEDTDPSARIDQKMNQERNAIETKLATLKRQPNLDFHQIEIDQYQEILDTLNYFKSNGGIIQAKERHTEVMQQVQRQLLESQQNNGLNLKQKNLIKPFTLQYKTQQQEYFKEKRQYDKQIQIQQEDNIIIMDQFEQKIKQQTYKAQEQVGRLKKAVERKVIEIEQQDIYLQSQYADKQKFFQSLLVLKKQKEQEHQQKVEQIKRNSTVEINKSLLELENRFTQQCNSILAQKQKDQDQQKQNLEWQIFKLNQEKYGMEEQKRVKEMLKAAELSKAKIEQDLKKQLEELNPQQEVKPSEVEFVKQFQAVQEEKLTVEQVKVIEKKHQQVEQVILTSLKQYQEKPKGQVSDEEQKKIDGYQGVLLMHAMLANQGITAYITDKPMQQLEQSSKGVYQQKIIQCGIQDSSSYLTANYASSLQMEKQILDAQGLPNYIQYFKNEIAKKLAEKDITPLNIQVFAVTIKPPRVNFQINSNSTKIIDIKGKDFSSLGIDVETQNLLDKAELSIDMFDPTFNMTWENMSTKTSQRGALQFKNRIEPTPQIYNFPIGYKGLGLRVLNRYGNDQRWIRADTQPGTWIVLFHGTGHKNLKGIIDQNNINPGENNAWGGTKCRITGTDIKDGEYENTYLTDDVKHAEHYSIRLNKIDKVPYKLIFQCRVNPKKVKSPENKPIYYTVENPLDDVRPYRLLIRKDGN